MISTFDRYYEFDAYFILRDEEKPFEENFDEETCQLNLKDSNAVNKHLLKYFKEMN